MIGTVRRLRRQNKKLKKENERLKTENTFLQGKYEEIVAENERLREENDALKQKIGELEEGINPKKKSTFKKNCTSQSKKPGRTPGFKGTSRKIPSHVDEVQDVTLAVCPHCGTAVKEVEVLKRYVEDIKPPKSYVREYRIHRYYCSTCKQIVSAKVLDVIPHCMLGISVMLFVVYQRYGLHLPYNKIRENLYNCFGIETTDATLYNAVKLISEYYREEFEKIKQKLRKVRFVHTDETGWRINGINHWLWTFITEKAAFYTIDKRRSSEVPKEILGKDFDGVVIADFYTAYDKLSCKQQKCLVHLLRETKKISERSTEARRFHKRITRFVRDAARFKEENPSSDLPKAFKRFEKRLTRIIREPYTDPDCVRLVKRLKKHKNSLLTFLEVEAVDYHNNTAERALRSSVVMRKITGGNRSRTGADTHEILMSILESHKLRNENFLEKSAQFMKNQLKQEVTSKS